MKFVVCFTNLLWFSGSCCNIKPRNIPSNLRAVQYTISGQKGYGGIVVINLELIKFLTKNIQKHKFEVGLPLQFIFYHYCFMNQSMLDLVKNYSHTTFPFSFFAMLHFSNILRAQQSISYRQYRVVLRNFLLS